MSGELVLVCFASVMLATVSCKRLDPEKLDLSTEGQIVFANGSTLIDRQEKFLSLFTIVRFSNDACVSSANLSGTCLTAAECSAGGGSSGGTCASGFGVCCVFSYSACGSTSWRNCTYFTTPTLSSSGQSCIYTINKCSSDVCQMRVDFLSFQIAQPNKVATGGGTTATATNCLQDQFYITNSATAYSPICGLNSGQHVYMDVSTTSSIKLNFALTSNNVAPNPANPTRSWNIKVTQIPCSSYYTLAPPGCLQYFKDVSGTITSFNYDTTTPANSHHLANQDYAICFRMETNYCTICYTVCDSSTANADTQFDLSGSGAAVPGAGGAAPTPAGATAAMSDTGTTVCFADYVIIPDAYNQGNAPTTTTANTMASDRLCGQRFNAATAASATHATVCSASKPFHFYVKTSADETSVEATSGGTSGFCLRYSQTPCSGRG